MLPSKLPTSLKTMTPPSLIALSALIVMCSISLYSSFIALKSFGFTLISIFFPSFKSLISSRESDMAISELERLISFDITSFAISSAVKESSSSIFLKY
jgi:hypothetical protein